MLRSFPVTFQRLLWSQGSKSTLDRNADDLPFVSDHKDSQPQGRLIDVYIGSLCSWSVFFLFYFNPCHHHKILTWGISYARLACCCCWLRWCSLCYIGVKCWLGSCSLIINNRKCCLKEGAVFKVWVNVSPDKTGSGLCRGSRWKSNKWFGFKPPGEEDLCQIKSVHREDGAKYVLSKNFCNTWATCAWLESDLILLCVPQMNQ